MAQSKTAVIRSDLDIVIARTMARDMAKALGFGPIDQARIATAVSELARNIFSMRAPVTLRCVILRGVHGRGSRLFVKIRVLVFPISIW
jgi:hypothetical protein